MDNRCGCCVYSGHTKRYRQVKSLEKAGCKDRSDDGCWSGSGRQSRGELKKKINAGMEEGWTACTVKKMQKRSWGEKKNNSFISL